MRRSRSWESGFACLSRESLRIGNRPRKRSRTLKGVFNVKATLMSIWWNCSRSAIRAKTIVIHTKRKHLILVANLAHSLQLSFLQLVKVILSGIGWATACYKINRWLLSLARGQSSLFYICVDKFSELQSLLLANSVRQLHLYLMGWARNSHSGKTCKSDFESRKYDIRLSSKKYLCIRIPLNWDNRI